MPSQTGPPSAPCALSRDRRGRTPVSMCPSNPSCTRLVARKEWVQRPGLVHELASAVSAKLVLVDAPAGFGKTTLVAQWRSSAIERRRFAWVSLDSGDDDPGRLWWHVVSALQRACPELDSQDIVRALRTQSPDIAEE